MKFKRSTEHRNSWILSGSNLVQYIQPKDWDLIHDNIRVWHNNIFLSPLDQSTGQTCQSVHCWWNKIWTIFCIINHVKPRMVKVNWLSSIYFNWSFQAKWHPLLCKYASLETALYGVVFNRYKQSLPNQSLLRQSWPSNSVADTLTVDKYLIRLSSKVADCAFKDICTRIHSAALTQSSKQVNQSCVFWHLLHTIARLSPPKLFSLKDPSDQQQSSYLDSWVLPFFSPSPKQVLCNTACACNHALLVMRLISIFCVCFSSGLILPKKEAHF